MQEQRIDSVSKCMQSFLQAQARCFPYSSQALVFNLEVKEEIHIIDSDKISYIVDEMYLASFRPMFVDKNYKYLKLQNWQFELQFDGKQCNNIYLLSDYITFFGGKAEKMDLKDCTFKAPVWQKGKNINKATKGYLNRIGKRNIVTHSQHVAQEFYSLLGFMGIKQEPPHTQPIIPKAPKQKINIMSRLSKEGIKALDKLRHFVTREQVMEFILEQELSIECTTKLRKIIMQEKVDEQ